LRKINLTKKGIAAFPTPQDGARISYYDTRVPGLGVMVNPTGNRVFFWFRKVRGRRTWRTVGEFPAMTVEQARDKAQEINTSLAKWKAADCVGPSPFEKRGDPTLSAVIEDYILKHVRKRAKNPERAEYNVRWVTKRYLKAFLSRKLGNISRQDVRVLHDQLGDAHGHVTANRTITMLRTLFNWAILKTEVFTGANPAARIEAFAESSRERYLLPEEMPVFLSELWKEKNRDLKHFVVLALFTGARKGDILSARWENVSFDAPSLRFPNPKSKKPYLVPLMPEAVAVLRERRALVPESTEPTESSPWVFPLSWGRTGHLLSVTRSWDAFIKRTKIENFHIHDLRRTFASYISNEGATLHITGKTLGHTSTAVTGIYAQADQKTIGQAITKGTRAMLTAGVDKKK
jgi:integrase